MNRETELEKYRFHLDQVGVKESPELKLLEEVMLRGTRNYGLEPSVKFKDARIFPARFNLNYCDGKRHIGEHLNAAVTFIMGLIRTQGWNINLKLWETLFDRVDLTRAKYMILGVDFREHQADSRVRLYFDIRDASGVLHVVKQHIRGPEVLEYLYASRNNRRILFGIDWFRDGRTTLKLYPVITRRDHRMFKPLIASPRAYHVTGKVKKTYVAFRAGTDIGYHLFVDAKSRADLEAQGLGFLFENLSFGMAFDLIVSKYRVKYVTIGDDDLTWLSSKEVNLYYY